MNAQILILPGQGYLDMKMININRLIGTKQHFSAGYIVCYSQCHHCHHVFWTWQQSEKEAGFSLYSQQDGDEYIGSDLLPAQTVFSLDFHAKQTLAADKTELKQRRY